MLLGYFGFFLWFGWWVVLGSMLVEAIAVVFAVLLVIHAVAFACGSESLPEAAARFGRTTANILTLLILAFVIGSLLVGGWLMLLF